MNMAQQLRQKMGVGVGKEKKFNIQYGHSDDSIVLLFGVQVDNLTMTEKQAADMIDALTLVKEKFAAHRATLDAKK